MKPRNPVPRRKADRERGYRPGVREWLVVVTLIALALAVQSCQIDSNTDDLEDVVATLHEAQVGSCDRVNTLRANDNKNASIEYEIIRLAEQLTGDIGDIAATFRGLARAVDFVPATNCADAVGDPNVYEAPRAIPLYRLSARDRRQLERTGVLP